MVSVRKEKGGGEKKEKKKKKKKKRFLFKSAQGSGFTANKLKNQIRMSIQLPAFGNTISSGVCQKRCSAHEEGEEKEKEGRKKISSAEFYF